MVSLPYTVYAERLLGDDHLALQHHLYKPRKVREAIPSRAPVGNLDWTFGTDRSPILSVCRVTKPRFWRTHLLDTTAVRNGKTYSYSPLYGYSIASLNKALENKDAKILAHVKKRTLFYKEIAAECPDTEWLISPALEHNLTKKAWRHLADVVRQNWQSVQLVNNPLNTSEGERYRQAWLESHGKAPHNVEITSLDGQDISDINVRDWLARTTSNKITFRWGRSYNCRTLGAFVDPRKRVACPKDHQYEEIVHITDRVPVPDRSFACNTSPLASPAINKPLAEDENYYDPRANLPVLIVAMARDAISLVTYQGEKAATYPFYGSFTGGLNRYYSGYNGGSKLGGYEVELKAEKLSGNRHVWAKQGDRCIGPFLAGRRGGSYR